MSGINFDKIDEQLAGISEQQEKQESQEQPFNELPTGGRFDLDKMVFELEKIGNKYIAKMHEDLAFDNDELELHSDMLAFILEKHFSLDSLKNTPEYMLAAQTAIMAFKFQRVYSELKEKGEI